MRWPWQRREQETAPQPALPARRDEAARVSPMGWAFLPPLQRQLGDMPLVARTASFPSQLPAWQNPSFTGTLAHRVSTDAPSGVIDGDGGGTGEPTVHSASPDLTLLAPAPVRPPPVQRKVAQTSSSEDGSRALPAPLTTAETTGLPVLAVQSYEAASDHPAGTPPEVVTDVSEDVPSETGQPPGESPSTADVAGPSTATPSSPTVQRAADEAAPLGTAASPLIPSSPMRARPSVGGRRLGLGAPLPALPLASDVPPVQRSADLPPALGSEGADGYVEVDIPSRPSRTEEPTSTAEAAAEPDVPTLRPATPRPEEGLDAARTPDTATSAPPAMPVAPLQRSLADTSGISAPEPFEKPADESPALPDATAPSEPAESGAAESHTEPDPVHDVPAPGTVDRPADGGVPPPTASSVQDRPVLAQRSIATPPDSVNASTPQPGPGHARASDAGPPARELRHTGGHPAASTEAAPLQRAVVGPSTGGPAGLTLQRSIESTDALASQDETTTGSVPSDEHGPVNSAPAPDRPSFVDAAADGDALTETAHPSAAPLVIAPTRPMLGTAAPLTSMATAPVQRAEGTTDVSGESESHWSPPTLTRTPGHAPTATALTPQLRPTRQPALPSSLQGAAVGAHLQRSVDVAPGSVARPAPTSSPRPSTRPATLDTTGSPGPQLDTETSPLPLAAPSPAEEPFVQTSLAEEPAGDPAGVPAEGAAGPAETRAAGSAAASSASPGADAAGGAAGASSPEQLEALAGRLFAPLMRRIRSEMLLDRERRGLRTDAW